MRSTPFHCQKLYTGNLQPLASTERTITFYMDSTNVRVFPLFSYLFFSASGGLEYLRELFWGWFDRKLLYLCAYVSTKPQC